VGATWQGFPSSQPHRLWNGVRRGAREAARRSGSLITARFALEQGREVLAVPGSPLDPRAEGTNDLIRQGATLITCAQDVLEVLLPLVEQRGAGRGAMSEGVPDADTEPLWDDYDFLSESPQSSALPNASDVTRWTEPDVDIGTGASDPTRSIIGLLGPTPVSVDELARASSFNIRIVQLVLFELEQAGRLERHGAALVSLRPVG
jgi:DNA processing protein